MVWQRGHTVWQLTNSTRTEQLGQMSQLSWGSTRPSTRLS